MKEWAAGRLLIYVEARSFYNMWRPKALFSHNGYGPGTRTQGPKAAGPGPGGPQLLALGPGPGPISIMAEHMGIKGNQ